MSTEEIMVAEISRQEAARIEAEITVEVLRLSVVYWRERALEAEVDLEDLQLEVQEYGLGGWDD